MPWGLRQDFGDNYMEELEELLKIMDNENYVSEEESYKHLDFFITL
jgi:hypothetical protein